jgi:hypothetical protein
MTAVADDDVEWEDHGGIRYPVITTEGIGLTGDELNDFIHQMREERIQRLAAEDAG